MFIFDIIDKKRKGKELTVDEINFAVNGFVEGAVLPEQMSALLMAIMLKGMTDDEVFALTKAMQNSGKTYSFDFDVVDKHSTGGVGDSTSLILLPILASLNVKVAKMSGKSLGYTGGTIDKLSCFKGFNVELSEKEFKTAIKKVGGSIISQSEEIAIADKKIYVLRDKCACVESIPLIASSVMSKKLASGSNTILLDVKFGNGAFMKTKKMAIKLAKLMVKIGKADGKNVCAMVTNMNYPLSYGVGCNFEVYSVIKALNGEEGNLLKLSTQLSAKLYSMATGENYGKSCEFVNTALNSGKALNKLKQIITNQGGSCEILDNPNSLLSSKSVLPVLSKCDGGYVKSINALTMAKVQKLLQENVKDDEKKKCGILLNVSVGSFVNKETVLANLYSQKPISNEIIELFLSGINYVKTKVKQPKLVAKIIR